MRGSILWRWPLSPSPRVLPPLEHGASRWCTELHVDARSFTSTSLRPVSVWLEADTVSLLMNADYPLSFNVMCTLWWIVIRFFWLEWDENRMLQEGLRWREVICSFFRGCDQTSRECILGSRRSCVKLCTPLERYFCNLSFYSIELVLELSSKTYKM